MCFFALKAREFDVKDVVTDPDPGSNASDDAMISVLEDHPGDPTYSGAAILRRRPDRGRAGRSCGIDVARARRDGSIEEWDDLREEAARLHNNRTSAYLLGEPMLADHLEEGLFQLGIACEDYQGSFT
jgi:hypothetical protein